MSIKRFDYIAMRIKSTEKVNNLDKKTFNDYIHKKIDLKECLKQFKSNNGIEEEYYIDDCDFEYWLSSIGWWR